MKSCQMYRFIPIMLLCVCLFTGGCSQNKDQPSAAHNQTPATCAVSQSERYRDVIPHRDRLTILFPWNPPWHIPHDTQCFLIQDGINRPYNSQIRKGPIWLHYERNNDSSTYTFHLRLDRIPNVFTQIPHQGRGTTGEMRHLLNNFIDPPLPFNSIILPPSL